MVYGLHPYIREYFNTTAPSNREFKNAKNAKYANPRNINPAKIKAHTVYTTRGDIFTEARSAEVNMPPRLYIEAMDRPTVLYILYTMVSA